MAQPLGRVKACTECRQQKLRCDAQRDYSQPCSRCARLALDCVVTRSFTRSRTRSFVSPLSLFWEDELTVNVRKAELVREINGLRRQTKALQSQNAPGAENVSQEWVSDKHSSPTEDNTRASSTVVGRESGITHDLHASLGNTYSSQHKPSNTIESFDGNVVDKCFTSFFKHYSISVPGLCDPNLSPLDYYERSPFLFWTILGTGGRRFEESAMLDQVTKRIMEIALPSIYSIPESLPAIQAVLILCVWPLPMSTNWNDPSFALIGAAIQLAVQHGLHVTGHEQDFSRTVSQSSSVSFRSCLWAHCLIVFQSTSLCGGLPAWSIAQSRPQNLNRELQHCLPSYFLYQFNLHRIQTTAISTILASVDLDQCAADTSLDSLVEAFDDQLRCVPVESNHNRSSFLLSCARLSVRTMHFFNPSNHTPIGRDHSSSNMILIFALACTLIDQAINLDTQEDFAYYAPNYARRMMTLAAICILRISRSRLRGFVAVQAGEEALFNAVRFFKKASLQSNDLDSRTAMILTQLWGSDKIFRIRSTDEQDGLRLSLRSRLVMSVVFDCFWWWRAEFGGSTYPYSNSSERQEQSNPDHGKLVPASDASSTLPTTSLPNGPTGTEHSQAEDFSFPSLMYPGAFDDVLDWQWAVDYDFPDFDSYHTAPPHVN